MNYISPEERLKIMGAVEVLPFEHPEPVKPPITATPTTFPDDAKIPPRAFLYGRHLSRKHVSVTVAPGGLGKSSLTLAEAIAMATGKTLLGQPVGQPLRVWVWNLEDPRDELNRRLAAIRRHYGVTNEDLGGRLFMDSGREQRLCTAGPDERGPTVHWGVIDRLVDELKAKRIDVLIVDPFVSSHEVSENDNPMMDKVAKAWGDVADKANAAISLVHHTRKAPAGGVTETNADSARGASALVAAARDVRCLTRMTKEEGEKAGVDNHCEYFRVYSDKANLAPPAPPAEHSNWYHLQDVELANTDHVGVVTPWSWPDPFDGVTVDDLLAVQRDIDGKNYRKDAQSEDWIGKAVGEILGLDPADKTDRARIKKCIKTWTANGALVESKTKDRKGVSRPIIEVGEWAT